MFNPTFWAVTRPLGQKQLYRWVCLYFTQFYLECIYKHIHTQSMPNYLYDGDNTGLVKRLRCTFSSISQNKPQICRLLCFTLMNSPSNPYLIIAGNVIFLFHTLHWYTWGRSKKSCLCLEEKLHLPSKGSGQRTRWGLCCTVLRLLPSQKQPSRHQTVQHRD